MSELHIQIPILAVNVSVIKLARVVLPKELDDSPAASFRREELHYTFTAMVLMRK